MKLLFDQNISYRIVDKIQNIFPDSSHVKMVGLTDATDSNILHYAKTNGYIIVTFDADFADIVTIQGYPPKIIWLRTGNTMTNEIEMLLKKHAATIKSFVNDKEHACLEIHE